MKFEIILGCMFSGKSTELIRRLSRYQAINKNILAINHSFDVRTDNSIQTHKGTTIPALKTNKLMNLVSTIDYQNAEIIGVDEAQFFEDLFEFVLTCEKKGKDLIICGLDGDYQRKPMGQILNCIPLCDSVVKLNALDKDGSDAIFTKRINNEDGAIVIGGADKYIAVSRANYFK